MIFNESLTNTKPIQLIGNVILINNIENWATKSALLRYYYVITDIMKGNVLLIFLFLTPIVGFSQEQDPNKIEQVVEDELAGTFQIILSDRRMVEPEVTDQILQLVDSERLQAQDVYLELDDYTKLYIPSYDQITGENFVELNPYRYE
jgi:hypothetical protein